jgi:hypothetical protein
MAFPPQKKKPVQGGDGQQTDMQDPAAPGQPRTPGGPYQGMPMAGQGFDPNDAMMGMGGPGMWSSASGSMDPTYPMGPEGLPFGGSMPEGPMALHDSPLLSSLLGSMSHSYELPPGGPDHVFDGESSEDPHMGLEQLLQMLALAQGGVGLPAGGSGIPVSPTSTAHGMMGC